MYSLELFNLPWILASVVVLFAAFVRGVAGFGMGLVMTPILLFILPPKSVVVIGLLLALLSNLLVLRYGFRNVHPKKIIPMVAGGLMGIPLGTWIITVIAPSALKVLIGGVTVFFAIPLALGFTKAFTREKLAGSVSGFLSGVLTTSTSLGGPPVALFMHNQNWPKEEIHSNLSAFFLVNTSCSLIALATSGLIDAQILKSAAILAPALLIGVGLGIVVFRRVNPRFFRGLTLVVIVGTGIMGILSGLGIFT